MMHNEIRISSTDVIPSPTQKPGVAPVSKTEDAQNQTSSPKTKDFRLTEREQQVLDLLTTGLSNGEIGNKLHLSPRTVEKHVSNLLRKTDTNNRAELVRFALDNHLVE
jgi:DNA-binding NarL/FixJ family response regulator